MVSEIEDAASADVVFALSILKLGFSGGSMRWNTICTAFRRYSAVAPGSLKRDFQRAVKVAGYDFLPPAQVF